MCRRPIHDCELRFSEVGNLSLPQATSYTVEDLCARLGIVQSGISITSFPIIIVYA